MGIDKFRYRLTNLPDSRVPFPESRQPILEQIACVPLDSFINRNRDWTNSGVVEVHVLLCDGKEFANLWIHKCTAICQIAAAPAEGPLVLQRAFFSVSRRTHGSPYIYCQRKIFKATMKLTNPQAARMAISRALPAIETPSFITERKASLSAVSGSALMNGCRRSGNRAAEKKLPDSNHIGSITRFINPDAPSIVWVRAPTSNPIPANVSEPTTAISNRLSGEP